MFGLGIGEILLIVFVVFLIAPRDIPRVMRKIARFFDELGKIREEFLSVESEVDSAAEEGDIREEWEDSKRAAGAKSRGRRELKGRVARTRK